MESRFAAPDYLQRLGPGDELPPGHAYFMYFMGTMSQGEVGQRETQRAEAKRRSENPAEKREAKRFLEEHDKREAWFYDAEGRRDGLARAEAASSSPLARRLGEQLSARQARLAQAQGLMSFGYQLTSPLVTGTGIAHPLENGFAFLWPYGVPYLAGSGVKGAVRRAAEMLACGGAGGLVQEVAEGPRWSWPAVWSLFGFDPATPIDRYPAQLGPEASALLEAWLGGGVVEREERGRAVENAAEFLALIATQPGVRRVHARGALEFWDMIPMGTMAADIMNPHAGKYYNKGETPAECDAPIPINFLVLERGARLAFHVGCRSAFVPEPLRQDWKKLLEQAFGLLAEWLGVGGKTAVGYGALGPLQPTAAAAAPRPGTAGAGPAPLPAGERRAAAGLSAAQLKAVDAGIADLRRVFEQERARGPVKPQGQARNHLGRAMKQASLWPPTKIKELLALAEAIFAVSGGTTPNLAATVDGLRRLADKS